MTGTQKTSGRKPFAGMIRRGVAAVLALLIALVFAVPALAQETDPTGSSSTCTIGVATHEACYADISSQVVYAQSTVPYNSVMLNVEGTALYAEAYAILTRVNQERAKVGAGALSMNTTLLGAAMQRAAELNIFYSHTRPDGSDCFAVSGALSGYVGENIAMGHTSPAMVMDAWMDSDGHRRNILDPNYKSLGIGAVYANGKYYWAQEFSGAAATTPTRPANKEARWSVTAVSSNLGAVSSTVQSGVTMTMTNTTLPTLSPGLMIMNKGFANKGFLYRFPSGDLRVTLGNATVGTLAEGASGATVFKPSKAGSATITVAAKNYPLIAEKVAVTVVDNRVKVKSISLTPASLRIAPGEASSLASTINPGNAYNRTLTWSSSNTNVAKVNQQGKVTAVAIGAATITAKANDGSGMKGSCAVKVAYAATGLTLDKTSLTFAKPGMTATVTATVRPEYATDKTVLWTSSNKNVAVVNSSGRVTAVAGGMAVITATAVGGDNLWVNCIVTVTQPVTSLKLSSTSKTVNAGSKFTLKPTIAPANATNKALKWTSSNKSVATVSASGRVTARKAGTATITAKTSDGGKSVVCNVKVKQPVTGIKLSTSVTTISGKGKTAQLKAAVSPADATSKKVAWKSSNTKVATVNANGKVTAKAASGTCTITCTAKDGSGKSAKYTIYVGKKVKGVKLNAASKTLTTGKTLKLKATLSPSTAAIKAVSWKSSNTKIATVDKNGKVKGIKAGKVTITCTTKDGKKTAKCKITVKAPFTGWKAKGGGYAYYRKDTLQTGWQKIGGHTYYLMQYDCYGIAKGTAVTGWWTINGKTYYFRQDGNAGVKGRMTTGTQTINGVTYTFGPDGALR